MTSKDGPRRRRRRSNASISESRRPLICDISPGYVAFKAEHHFRKAGIVAAANVDEKLNVLAAEHAQITPPKRRDTGAAPQRAGSTNISPNSRAIRLHRAQVGL
jgi:hypothetical protein